MLTILLFGPPEVQLDDQPLSISRRKSRALLYYLAASPRPVQREQLLNLFWADTERSAAQQVLRTTLHGLRKELGEHLAVERDAVALRSDTQVDARMFARNLSTPGSDVLKLETVLSLYRGPFLDGFVMEESVAFEQWYLAERERYQRLAVRGMVSLSQAHAAVGEYAAGLQALERGLALDPLQEDLQRETLRLAYLAGDRAGAIRRYDQLRRLLDEELGVPPMAETRRLYDQILSDDLPAPTLTARAEVGFKTPAARTAVFILPFSGRENELRQLREGLSNGRLLLVEGEPGVGKTRLVEEFLSSLEGGIYLRGAGRELETNLPYQPVVEAMRGLLAQPQSAELVRRVRATLPPVWLGEVARLLPELAADSNGTADEWRLWEGVRQFLCALADLRPVILFLDDLQWADSSTLGLLGYLVRNLSAGDRVSMVAASWPPVTGSGLNMLLTTLERQERARRIPLERFSAEDVQRAIQPLAVKPQPLAEWLYLHSEGNLYYLAELVRQARQNGWLDGQMPFQADTAPEISGALYGLVTTRLARLSEAGRRVLDTAVAVGRDFDFDVVARASGLSENAALDGLDELLAAGLVTASAGATTIYRFDHSLTMEVAYREVGEARHRQLHRQIAEALKQVYRYHPPKNLDGLLAFHYAEGGQPQRAAPHAALAGETAMRLAAWQPAAAFFAQALEAAEESQRFTLLLNLAQAQFRGGEFARAVETNERALRLAQTAGDRAGIDAARLMLAQTFIPLARFEEMIAQTRAVLEEGLPENAAQAELWWGTALSLEGADLPSAGEHLAHAATLGREAASSETLAVVEFEAGSLWAQRGDLQEAIRHYREALRVAEESDTPLMVERQALAHNNLAYHLLLLNDPQAEEHARRGLELAQARGLLAILPYLYSTSGEVALARQDWDAARANFERGLELAQRLGIPERVVGLTANLGLLAREERRSAQAAEQLAAARDMADEAGLQQLAAQIRLWIAPLLAREAGLAQLDEARTIAQRGGRMRLLEEEKQVRQQVEGER